MSAVSLSIEGITDVGRVRENNEDGFMFMKYKLRSDVGDVELMLATVGDGVGGLAAGEVASRTALLAYSSSLLSCVTQLIIDDRLGDGEIAKCVRDSVNHANSVVKSRAVKAGTTLVSALAILSGSSVTAYVVNVGDSRAYLINGDEIYQVTQDHSVAWEDFVQKAAELVDRHSGDELVRRYAELKRKIVTEHPRAHVIRSVVGYYAKVDLIGIYKLKLQCNDVLLLASDGLTDMLDDLEILSVVKGGELPDAAKALVAEANRKGGEDNITVVLMRVDCQSSKK